MIGPSTASTSIFRPLPYGVSAVPELTPQSYGTAPAAFSGFQPTWHSMQPMSETFTSPAGYPITKFTLPNGHRLFIEQRPTQAIGVRTFVNAGSIMENAAHPSQLYPDTGLPSGIAHLDEHCRFLATEHFPMKNTLSNTMTALGSQYNATTSPENIHHDLFFNREDLGSALKLHAEAVLRPIYNPADVNQEKTNVLNEAARAMRPPNFKIGDKLNELLFDRTARQTLGSPQDVLRTTPEHFQQFRNAAYAPTNLVTVVSGNVNPNEVFHILAPEFGANPPRYSPLSARATRLALPPGEIRSANIIDPQFTNSQVVIGFPAPPQTSFTERMAFEFLNEILNGDSLSLLQDQLANRQQLANNISTEFVPFKQTGYFAVGLETTPGREQTTLANTLNIIQQLSQGLVSDQKIEQVRERLMHRFMAQQNNIQVITAQLGEAAICNTLPYYLNYTQLASLVTAEDLMAVSRKYLSPNRFAVVFGLPPHSASIGGAQR